MTHNHSASFSSSSTCSPATARMFRMRILIQTSLHRIIPFRLFGGPNLRLSLEKNASCLHRRLYSFAKPSGSSRCLSSMRFHAGRPMLNSSGCLFGLTKSAAPRSVISWTLSFERYPASALTTSGGKSMSQTRYGISLRVRDPIDEQQEGNAHK